MVKVKEDLTGKTFGRLTVIKQVEDYIDKKGKHYAQWLCECSCEEHKQIIVRGNQLKSGNTKSCGCLRVESNEYRKENLIGQKYGRLTVVAPGPSYIFADGSKLARWWCQCDCDNPELVLVFASRLKNGTTKSCGCLKRERLYERNRKYNRFEIIDSYGICYMSNGEIVLFDTEDYDLIKDYYWRIDSKGYAMTSFKENNKPKHILMHRLIMGVDGISDNIEIDHIRHNKLDNRKSELRLTTKSQNMQNQSLSSVNTSGITGVAWHKDAEKWRAYIHLNHKYIHLGLFQNFENAVSARKDAEEKYYGEYSYENSMNYIYDKEMQKLLLI